LFGIVVVGREVFEIDEVLILFVSIVGGCFVALGTRTLPSFPRPRPLPLPPLLEFACSFFKAIGDIVVVVVLAVVSHSSLKEEVLGRFSFAILTASMNWEEKRNHIIVRYKDPCFKKRRFKGFLVVSLSLSLRTEPKQLK